MKKKAEGGAVSASMLYCTASVVTKLITLLTTPIFTRLLSPTEYGKFALYVSLYGIVASISSVPVSAGVLYNLFGNKKERIGVISLSGFLISIPINAVFCLLLFAFSYILDFPRDILPLLFLHTVLDVAVSAHLAKSKYFYKARSVMLIEIAKSLLSVVLAYFLISKLGFGYIGRVLAFLITLIPFALPAVISLFASFRKMSLDTASDIIRNSVPSLISTVFLSLGTYSVSLLISAILGEDTLATFSVFNTVGASPIFIITALISALSPYIQRKADSLDFPSLNRAHSLASSLMSSVIMLVFLITKESLGFLAPKQYIENIFIILPLLLYAELKLSDQFLSSVLNARRVYKPTVIANLCFSLFSVSSLLLLLPTIGLFAAGTGLILGTAASLIYKLYSISKIGISAITANDIFSPTLICLVFGALALSLSNHPEIRLLLAIYPAIKLLNLYFGDIKGDKTELKLN